MKINRGFILFSIVVIILLSLVLTVFYKYSPLTLKHTLYYCQQSLWALSISSYYIITAIFIFSLLSAVLTVIKTFIYRMSLKTNDLFPSSTLRIVKKSNLSGKVKMIRSKEPLVFCIGLIHPQIYISEGLITMMTEKELTAILLHERHHLLERDNIKIFILTLLKDFLIFFPFVAERVQRFIFNKEVHADQRAVKFLQSSASLLSAFEKLLSYEVKPMNSVSYFINTDSLEYRIENLSNINNHYPMYTWRSIVISIASFLLFLLLLISPLKKTEVHAFNKDVVLVCNGDNNIKAFSSQVFSSVDQHLYSSAPL